MAIAREPQNSIDCIRCPDIGGLPEDTVILLHNSLVHIVRMRRSIEAANRQVQRAKAAACDSERLLADLRRDGF